MAQEPRRDESPAGAVARPVPDELALAAAFGGAEDEDQPRTLRRAARLLEYLMTKPGAFVLILTGLVINPAVAAERAAVYKLIVNAANPVTTLSHEDVSRIFLKKTTKWPNGQPVLPVDLPTSAPSRRAFSKGVLGRDPNEIGAYWNQVIFSGRAVPPVTKSSDSEVLAYVRDNPNAIGYVAADTNIGGSVKVLTLRP